MSGVGTPALHADGSGHECSQHRSQQPTGCDPLHGRSRHRLHERNQDDRYLKGGQIRRKGPCGCPDRRYTAAEGVIRPPTPQYPKLAKIFEKAASDISNGAEVQSTLDGAVDEIDADIKANNGYGFQQ